MGDLLFAAPDGEHGAPEDELGDAVKVVLVRILRLEVAHDGGLDDPGHLGVKVDQPQDVLLLHAEDGQGPVHGGVAVVLFRREVEDVGVAPDVDAAADLPLLHGEGGQDVDDEEPAVDVALVVLAGPGLTVQPEDLDYLPHGLVEVFLLDAGRPGRGDHGPDALLDVVGVPEQGQVAGSHRGHAHQREDPALVAQVAVVQAAAAVDASGGDATPAAVAAVDAAAGNAPTANSPAANPSGSATVPAVPEEQGAELGAEAGQLGGDHQVVPQPMHFLQEPQDHKLLHGQQNLAPVELEALRGNIVFY